jgi:hypothetical protein
MSICAVFSCLGAQEYLELRICDMHNRPLSTVGVGQPCMLEVILHNSATSMHAPQIQRLDQFAVARTGVRMSTINGVSSVAHTYKMRIDKAGTYTIGPATVQALVSEPLTITVADQQVIQQPAKQTRKQQQAQREPIAVVFSVDKDAVVVGQEIVCTLQCFYDPEIATVRQLSLPDTQTVAVRDIQEGVVRQEVRNGAMQHVAQWQWYLYPQKAGLLTLPACSVEATMRNNPQQQQWGAFSLLFNIPQMNERFYSNGVSIEVAPLPVQSQAPVFVGEITDFQATIEPTTVNAGEAMILNISLTGKTDFARLGAFDLGGMPPALKYYPSEQTTTSPFPCGVERTKKYTFIVQAHTEGTYEIPPQSITYFDVVSKQYKTITTEMLQIVVHAAPHGNKTDTTGTPTASENNMQGSVSPATFMLTTGHWSVSEERTPLTLGIFFSTLLIPLCCGLGIVGYRRRRFYLSSAQARYANAYKKARASLDKQETQRSAAGVYHIFIVLIHNRLMIPTSQACLDDITAILKHKNMSYDILERWETFVQEMGAYAFGNKRADEKTIKLFFCAAREWLAWCEREF